MLSTFQVLGLDVGVVYDPSQAALGVRIRLMHQIIKPQSPEPCALLAV